MGTARKMYNRIDVVPWVPGKIGEALQAYCRLAQADFIGDSHLAMLASMIAHSDWDTGRSHPTHRPSMATLGARAGSSRRTGFRVLNELVDLGIVETERMYDGGNHRPNAWRLYLPAPHVAPASKRSPESAPVSVERQASAPTVAEQAPETARSVVPAAAPTAPTKVAPAPVEPTRPVDRAAVRGAAMRALVARKDDARAKGLRYPGIPSDDDVIAMYLGEKPWPDPVQAGGRAAHPKMVDDETTMRVRPFEWIPSPEEEALAARAVRCEITWEEHALLDQPYRAAEEAARKQWNDSEHARRARVMNGV